MLPEEPPSVICLEEVLDTIQTARKQTEVVPATSTTQRERKHFDGIRHFLMRCSERQLTAKVQSNKSQKQHYDNELSQESTLQQHD